MSIDDVRYASSNNSIKLYGLYRAKCLNNRDPDGMGRILVHIFGRDGNFDYDEDKHQWVPVLSPFGGLPGMGLFMLPPIHADGFVIFENGNPSNPIWIGSYPFAPIRKIDEEASKSAGYTVIKTLPTVPPESGYDPTTIVLKSQYTTLSDPSVESDNNKVENTIIMNEEKLELFHVNQTDYQYDVSGVSSTKSSSFIRLKDQSIVMGVKTSEGKEYSLTIDSSGIKITSFNGDNISVTDGTISIQGGESSTINIKTGENGSINVITKNFIQDAESIVAGSIGQQGGGGAVTTMSICPFVGLPIHQGSSKLIVGS